MPFNPSGLLVRLHNWVSDRDAGTKILAERMDQEFDNAFTGINAILGGEQAFLGPIEVPFGTAAEPAVQIGGEMGIYRKTATTLGVSIGGVEVAVISPAGTSAPEARTAMTREKGDARYPLKDHAHSEYLPKAGGTLTAPLFVTTSVYAVSPDAATNAHYWLRDHTGGNRATLFADPGGGSVRLRKYSPAGATTGDIVLTDTEAAVTTDLTVGGGYVMHSGRGLGEKGCVIFAKSASPTAKTYGDTISGANLQLADNTGSTISTPISGTWKSLGHCYPGNAGNFVRIA